MIPTTRPDPDKLANSASADLHAGKLVGLKALKDLARFEWFTSLPLSIRETIAAAAGALFVLVLLVTVGMILLK